MSAIDDLYERNINLLENLDIDYKEVSHEPVLSYEAAEEVKEKFNLSGVESKNLFLKTEDGDYLMFITVKDQKADFDLLAEKMGSRVSMASFEELEDKTSCEPKCAVPFGLPEDITLVVDETIFDHKKFIYSPGPPEKTVEIKVEDIPKILENVENRVVYV